MQQRFTVQVRQMNFNIMNKKKTGKVYLGNNNEDLMEAWNR